MAAAVTCMDMHAGSDSRTGGLAPGSRMAVLLRACTHAPTACGASRAAWAHLAARMATVNASAWNLLGPDLVSLMSSNHAPMPVRCAAAAGIFDGAFMNADSIGDEVCHRAASCSRAQAPSSCHEEQGMRRPGTRSCRCCGACSSTLGSASLRCRSWSSRLLVACCCMTQCPRCAHATPGRQAVMRRGGDQQVWSRQTAAKISGQCRAAMSSCWLCYSRSTRRRLLEVPVSPAPCT